MGKPPGHDDEREGSGGGRSGDDLDRAAILARRQRFIALALTSLVGALMLLARRRQLERRLALVAAGRAGTVDASG